MRAPTPQSHPWTPDELSPQHSPRTSAWSVQISPSCSAPSRLYARSSVSCGIRPLPLTTEGSPTVNRPSSNRTLGFLISPVFALFLYRRNRGDRYFCVVQMCSSMEMGLLYPLKAGMVSVKTTQKTVVPERSRQQVRRRSSLSDLSKFANKLAPCKGEISL